MAAADVPSPDSKAGRMMSSAAVKARIRLFTVMKDLKKNVILFQ
jgi:hypothetical protein